MKKHVLIVCEALVLLSLFSGCRKRTVPGETTVPTRPLATVMPTKPETVPATRPETVPATRPGEANAAKPRETTRPTIEDGNGPIPSQKPGPTEK